MVHTFVILLNYHGSEDTKACIDSLLTLTNALTIVVVDNSNGLEEWERLKAYAKFVEVPFLSFEEGITSKFSNEKIVFIKAQKNRGFSAGNNIGISFALQQKAASHLWILNNDTIVLQNTLTALIKQQQQQPKTILGSKLLYFHDPKIIQAVGGVFNKRYYISEHIGEGLSAETPKSELPKIDYPVGASIFVSRDFVETVGLLDENFFLYYEELDWVYRAKEKGYIVDWCEDSVVYHKEGASIGSSYKKKKSYFSEVALFKSRQKFVKKHFGLNTMFYFATLLLLINRLRKGQLKLVMTIFKNTIHGN